MYHVIIEAHGQAYEAATASTRDEAEALLLEQDYAGWVEDAAMYHLTQHPMLEEAYAPCP